MGYAHRKKKEEAQKETMDVAWDPLDPWTLSTAIAYGALLAAVLLSQRHTCRMR